MALEVGAGFFEAFGKEVNELLLWGAWSGLVARTLVREVLDVGIAPVEGLKKSLIVVCVSLFWRNGVQLGHNGFMIWTGCDPRELAVGSD